MVIVEHYPSRRTILPLPDLSRRSAAQAEGEGRGEGERAQPIDCQYYSPFFSSEILVALGVLACGLRRRLTARKAPAFNRRFFILHSSFS
jgi:hypothetical protein